MMGWRATRTGLLGTWALCAAIGCGSPSQPHASGGGDGSSGADASPGDAAPWVLSSAPADGSTDVYPFELHRTGATTLRRKRVQVTFSEPMDTTSATVPLAGPEGAPRSIPVQWSADARSLSLEIGPPDPMDGGSLPLEYASSYALDLRALRSSAGVPIDEEIAFTTAAQDSLLEHACGHTFDDPYAYVVATAAPQNAPAVGLTHKRYMIQLPEPNMGPDHAGHVSQAIPLAGATDMFEYTLFLGADVSAEIVDAASGESIAVGVRETPPVCELIQHARTAVLTEGHEYVLRFGLSGASTFDLIFERDLVVP
ncbi:Ig-like domain-containing protein [Polyangium aurulentum]|uniref:Ig-like domain-containing protein n=1 Tax=Polyangium aurulentum TaxID=2567896 RepID=UPI00146E042B|nr:Ig-like domain-containing protein [Polyangium aurulentum]UQA60042.1 Ig-like domain-containing protein [Polyangium aurulentum]